MILFELLICPFFYNLGRFWGGLKMKNKLNNDRLNSIKGNMIDEFNNRIDEYINNYRKTTKRDLKKKINELDQYVVKNDERLGMLQLALATEVYKERFKKEIIVKGVIIDASGNVIRNGNNNIHSNI